MVEIERSIHPAPRQEGRRRGGGRRRRAVERARATPDRRPFAGMKVRGQIERSFSGRWLVVLGTLKRRGTSTSYNCHAECMQNAPAGPLGRNFRRTTAAVTTTTGTEAMTRRCELTSDRHNRFKMERALSGRRIQTGSASGAIAGRNPRGANARAARSRESYEAR